MKASPTFARPGRIYSVLIVGSLCIAGALGYALWLGFHMTATQGPLVDATMEIKLEAAMGHLSFEEALDGHVSADEVWKHYDASEWYVRAMLEGGENPEGKFIRVNDPQMRQELSKVLQKLAELKSITAELLKKGEASGKGVELDQKHDALFTDLMKEADDVETVLQKMISRELATFHWMLSSLIVSSFLLFLIAGILVRQYLAERKSTEQELQQSEDKLRSIFDHMLNGFAYHEIVTDEAGKPVDYVFLDVNDAFEKMMGLKGKDVIGKRVTEALPGIETGDFDWIGVYGKVALTGEETQFEQYSEALDRWCDISAYSPAVGYFAVMIDDITKRKRAEEDERKLGAQLQHAQKLESLGVLAGGIAHDFNNLLVGILGYADLTLEELSRNHPARSNIERVRQAAIRAAELTNQMLAYSGKGKFIVKALNLNNVIEEMGQLLEVSIPKKTILKYDLSDNLPAIEADATQIRQVVMNLVINAAEAVGEKSGIVTLRTGVCQADRSYLTETYLDENLPEGYYVYMEVSDTGHGMSEETKNRLFDPFFTTKFIGRGLGLAAVLGIVRGHMGAIKVYSEEGRGSTFKALFPCSQEEAEKADDAPPASDIEQWRASGTILVVDDEETVCNVAKMMFERIGFDVITAPDGEAGVAAFRERAEDITAVLLDMTMPRMDGEQAFREMRSIRSDVKVVLCSGYNEQEATSRFAGKGLAGFIQKPFQMHTLMSKFQEILES